MTVASTIAPLRFPPATTLAPLATASAISSSIRSAAARLTSEPEHDMAARIAGRQRRGALGELVDESVGDRLRRRRGARSTCRSARLAKAPKTAASTAASMSASSSTISGALPPSSSSTGFRCSAASLAMILPTLDEPVKLTRLTAGWAISAATTFGASSGALVITLTTPFGKPGVVQRSRRSGDGSPGRPPRTRG